MKLYKVKVNGKIYEVELESVEENNQTIDSESKSKPSNTNQSATGKTIKSPMQGDIQKILVKPGQTIKKGESVLILEAMKMENDITADHDYLILDVLVKEGDSVDNDQPLIKVE